jgi:hypothetical protein
MQLRLLCSPLLRPSARGAIPVGVGLTVQGLIDKLKQCNPDTPVCLLVDREKGPFFLTEAAWLSPTNVFAGGEVFLLSHQVGSGKNPAARHDLVA